MAPLDLIPEVPDTSMPTIDPSKARVLFSLLSYNSPRKVAVRASKIGEAEFKRYMARGERQRKGEFRDFYESVLFAESQAEFSLLRILHETATDVKNDGANPHVPTVKYLLERRYRSRWSDRSTGNQRPLTLEAPVQDAGVMLDHAERLARIEALRAIASTRVISRLGSADPAEVMSVEDSE